MTLTAKSKTLKILIIIKIIALLLDNTYAGFLKELVKFILCEKPETRLKNCNVELETIFNIEQVDSDIEKLRYLMPDSNVSKEYFKRAILNTSVKSTAKYSYINNFLIYFLTKITPDHTFQIPIVFCDTEFREKSQDCKNEIAKAKFLMEDIDKKFPKDHISSDVMSIDDIKIKYNQIRSVKFKIVKHAYNNIGPDDYKEKTYLTAYMRYIAYNENDIMIAKCETIYEYCIEESLRVIHMV